MTSSVPCSTGIDPAETWRQAYRLSGVRVKLGFLGRRTGRLRRSRASSAGLQGLEHSSWAPAPARTGPESGEPRAGRVPASL